MKFLSGMNATLSIAITESGKPIQETVVSHTSKASVVVRGDVVSDSVKLDNALIFGNVRSREVSLVNSIIVGSIFAEETLRLENSNFVALSFWGTGDFERAQWLLVALCHLVRTNLCMHSTWLSVRLT